MDARHHTLSKNGTLLEDKKATRAESYTLEGDILYSESVHTSSAEMCSQR